MPMSIPGQELLLRLPAVLGTAGVVTGHVKTQEIETTTRATALFVPLCVCVCLTLCVCVLSGFKQIYCLPTATAAEAAN